MRRGLVLAWLLLGGAPAEGSPSSDEPSVEGRRAKRERARERRRAPAPIIDARELTLEQINGWAAELAPVVGEVAGRPFDKVPHVRLGTPGELERIVEGEARLVLGRIYDAPAHVIDRMARDSRASVPGILGKYGIETRVLYLSGDAIASVVEHGPFEPHETERVAKLILAHELVHALQDQEADMLPIFTNRVDVDALNAFRAVTEGHANLIEERVAERLGLADVHERMNASQGWGPEGATTIEAWPIWAVYGQGRNFVHHHWALGGDDRVWTLLTSPPSSTTMIFRPERYAATLPPGPDYRSALDGIEGLLTAGPWTTVQSAVAEYDLRLESQRHDQERLDELISHLVRGQGLNAVRPDREANVRVLDFDRAEHAVGFVRFLREQAEAAAAMATGGFGLSITVSDYDRIAADLGVERVLGAAGSDTPSLERRSVWVVRGSRVVEITVHGFRPGLRMQAALVEVFARLERLDADR